MTVAARTVGEQARWPVTTSANKKRKTAIKLNHEGEKDENISRFVD
jgi:hypothetical protein